MMKINICGIPHKVIYCKDEFNTDTHYGQIDYGKAVIKISEDVSKEQQDEALCHEVLHGILVHIGKSELSQDEEFVSVLSNAIYQSFIPNLDGEEADEVEPEIIRCKDCVHYSSHKDDYMCGINVLAYIHENDFCSRAERRGEDE